MSALRSYALVVVAPFLIAAEKPSPFIARTSAPAAPAAAPVSPVAPALSILRANRQKPIVAGAGSVAPLPMNGVSPVNRPVLGNGSKEVAPPPPAEKVVAPDSTAGTLKSSMLEVPAMVVASVRPPQVSEIEKGMAKDAVVSKLGNPSTVISMYEDNRFHESLRYEWKGRWLGTVRLINGQVSRIDQP